ncbi:MAG: NAD(P)-dependent oxidoreductase [Acidimicrobiia bacterium]
MRIAVLGATGDLGSALVGLALDRGHRVVAHARDPARIEARPGLEVFGGAVTDVDAVAGALAGADAVVSCIGAGPSPTRLVGVDLMQTVLPALLAALDRAGAGRLVLVSAFGVGDTAAKASPVARLLYRTVMRSLFEDKARAERALEAADLDWVAVHPVTLRHGPAEPTEVVPLAEVARVPGLPRATYAGVARVLLDLAADAGPPRRRLLVAPAGAHRPVPR